MTGHAVVIAGGGPTGLMLAGELALAGVDVAIVERRENQELDSARAGGLHARTIEVLDQRNCRAVPVRGASAQGRKLPRPAGHQRLSDTAQLHTRSVAEAHRTNSGWLVSELRVPIYREREVTGFAQDETGVDVELSDGRSLRAKYLVGCDGGRSLICKIAGIDFVGWEPSISYLIAEAEMTEEPELGIRHDEKGTYGLGKHEDGRPVRVVLREERVN